MLIVRYSAAVLLALKLIVFRDSFRFRTHFWFLPRLDAPGKIFFAVRLHLFFPTVVLICFTSIQISLMVHARSGNWCVA